MSSLGQRIKLARKAAGLTQVQLAEMTKLSRSHIGAIEIDKYDPSLGTLNLIADALEVSVASLIEENVQDKKVKEKTLLEGFRNLNDQKKEILFGMLAFLNSPQAALLSGDIMKSNGLDNLVRS